MKIISPLLLTGAMVLALLALSCKEDPVLSLDSPVTLEFPFDGGPATISFTTNRPWTATASSDWCSLPQSSGEGGDLSITVNVAPNKDTSPRSCTISLKSEAATYAISVRQAQYPTIIPMSDRIELGWNDNAFTISTQYNQDYTVRIEGGEWLTHAETRSLSVGQVFFVAESNRTLNERSATVYMEMEGTSASIKVVQSAYTHHVLEETEPGFYGFNSSDVVYVPGQCQIGVTRYQSNNSFRILEPDGGVVAEVSGLPADLKPEESFEGSVSIIKDAAMAFSYSGPILVLKTSGKLCWLAVNDEDGIITRI